jgi:hypothetical protein
MQQTLTRWEPLREGRIQKWVANGAPAKDRARQTKQIEVNVA